MSANLVFNLDAVEDFKGFDVIPKGKYSAIIENLELTNAKSSGAAMLSAVFTICEGEYSERKIFTNYMLEGNGMEYSLPRLKQLIAVISPDSDMTQFDLNAFVDSGEAINKQCTIDVGVRTQKTGDYAGTKSNTINAVSAAAETASPFM